MISSAYRALELISTRSYRPVAFIWNTRTLQYIKAVATKVDRSIVADTDPMIQRGILAIMLPKLSTSCLGSSISLIFQVLEKRAGSEIVDL